MANPSFSEWLQGLIEPAVLLYWGVYSFFEVVLETLWKHWHPFALLPISKLRDQAFSRFWLRLCAWQSPTDQLVGSAKLVATLMPTATGDILEIGPGSGTNIGYLPAARVTSVVGAEPVAGLHAELLRNVNAAGLSDRYRVLGCGAQPEELVPALAKAGVLQGQGGGVFDCVVSIRVLCSVPRPEESVEGLYGLLRPGGRLIVVEHVANPWRDGGSVVARLMQTLYMWLGWKFFIGDCCLDRDLRSVLERAAKRDGGWERVDLETHFEWSALPYVAGFLVKKGKKSE